MINSKCSCSRRDKEKCVEESSTGCGKMCVKESLLPTSALAMLDEVHEEFKNLVYKEENQLTPEMQKIIMNNVPNNIHVFFHHKDDVRSEEFLKKLSFVQDNLSSRFVISLDHSPSGEDMVEGSRYLGNNVSQVCTAFLTEDLEESNIQFKYFVAAMENLYDQQD